MYLLDESVSENIKEELIKNPSEVSEPLLSAYLEKYKTTCLESVSYQDMSSDCEVRNHEILPNILYDNQITNLPRP